MKVLFVSPEISPFARTGGLGEVVGSLPFALKRAGIDVRVLCPRHRSCKSLPIRILKNEITFKHQSKEIISKIGRLDDKKYPIPIYFLINDHLFDRPDIYADENGNYPDNSLRAFVLSHAACELEKITKWKPGILHAHDWMAAPTCAYLNAKQEKGNKPKRQGSLLTIHNLEHQGVFTHQDFLKSRLPLSYWAMDGFEHHGSLNLLKGGIQHADKISTVSPTYAKEIRTVEHGQNLEECLRYRGADLVGILNGIDEEAWDPLTDESISHLIDPSAPSEGKKKCKEAILKEFKLSFPNKPLLAVVSRLYRQKGLDLLLSALPEILKNTDASIIILGSGAKDQENGFLKLAEAYPENVGVKIGFDDALARRIFAGSDLFVMPSRFEPCGLAQQYAMKYGAVPIARKTGGLADTIKPRTDRSKNHTGYLFDKADKISLSHAIKQACGDWHSKEFYSEMQTRTMQISCSWELAAQKYAQLYKWILAKF
jgi:starch synthase